MKKGILLSLLMGCMLVFAGCGSETPTSVANDFLAAIKAQDEEAIANLYAGASEDVDLGDVAAEDLAEEGAEGDEIDALLEEKLFDFDYSVADETIDGDNATVQVTINTYPMGEAMSTVLERSFSEMFELLFDASSTEEDIDNLVNNIMMEEFGNLTEKSYTETITLHLEKVDDAWKVVDINENEDNYELINALTGGIMTFAEDLMDSWGGLLDDDSEASDADYSWLWEDEETTDDVTDDATEAASDDAAA